MTIPDRLIEKAVRAQIIAEGRDPDDHCEQWKFDSYDHDVRVVLEAVAADIWEQGRLAGFASAIDRRGPHVGPHANPYRESENA